MNIIIRNEAESDYRRVEELTREAFWNLYIQGCDEHYLVHKMRTHSDFIPDLNFVAVFEDKVVGNIMYTKSYIIDGSNNRLETITFGPISVLPKYQKQGVGSTLIRHSKQVAFEAGHKAIIIEGHPHNYCKHGFKSSRDYNISDAEGKYPYSLLVFELEPNLFNGTEWRYYSSDVYNIDIDAVDAYDKQFEYKKKEYRYTQEEYSIASRAFIA